MPSFVEVMLGSIQHLCSIYVLCMLHHIFMIFNVKKINHDHHSAIIPTDKNGLCLCGHGA